MREHKAERQRRERFEQVLDLLKTKAKTGESVILGVFSSQMKQFLKAHADVDVFKAGDGTEMVMWEPGKKPRPSNERPRLKPTSTNIWALKDVFKGKDRVPNQLHATDYPHIRRCLIAGLCMVEGKHLVLTPAGRAAIDAY